MIFIYLWKNKISIQLVTGLQVLRHAGTTQEATSQSFLLPSILSLPSLFFTSLLSLPSLCFPPSFLSLFFVLFPSILPSVPFFLRRSLPPFLHPFHSSFSFFPPIFGTHWKSHASVCFPNMGIFSFHGEGRSLKVFHIFQVSFHLLALHYPNLLWFL